jgi:hypothetical protein
LDPAYSRDSLSLISVKPQFQEIYSNYGILALKPQSYQIFLPINVFISVVEERAFD